MMLHLTCFLRCNKSLKNPWALKMFVIYDRKDILIATIKSVERNPESHEEGD